MNQIKVNYEVLDDMARKLSDAADQTNDLLTTLTNSIRPHLEEMDGAAVSAFHQLENEHQREVVPMMQQLHALSAAVTKTGVHFNETDQAARRYFQG